MRRLKLLGLALMAVFASAATISASASALELPETLPALKAGETRAGTGQNIGNTTFHAQGQEPITCTAAKGEGLEETSKPPTGTAHGTAENCTSKAGGLTVKCTGLGDAAGVILVLGTGAGVFDKLIGKPFEKLTSAVLAKNEAVHFTCGGLVLVEVLAGGETLCLALNPTEISTTHEGHCIGEIAGGVPKAIEEWGTEKQLENKEGKVPVLLVSINHGTAVPALQLGLGVVTTKVNVSADQ